LCPLHPVIFLKETYTKHLMTFSELKLDTPLTSVLEKMGYATPTPIQSKAIPHILQGRDIFGCAQTGTGKTAAFALPLIQMLSAEKIPGTAAVLKALILAPTRELALQISENFTQYSKNVAIKHAVVFGGVSQYHQVNSMRGGIDVLIATPGRLLDLMQQGIVKLATVKYLVLDEADRMLDMGFIHDIKKVMAKLPPKRQTLFFSATATKDIMKLAETLLHNPVSVEVTPVSSASGLVTQSVYYVKKEDKKLLLKHILETNNSVEHALVFTRTKHGADKVVKELKRDGIAALAIHGNKSQNERVKALTFFKDKKIRVLVATDVASRGIDVEKLSHVINFDLPNEAESYVHRIGRTGRAGENGTAMSFCSADEMGDLKSITKLINKRIDVVEDHPYAQFFSVTASAPAATKKPSNGKKEGYSKNRRRQNYGSKPKAYSA
jgi:ATP-dependent RNA helicase RhlE